MATTVAASKYGKDFQVPKEYPGIVKEFTREVLRCQPENIYEFGYKYFDDLYKALAAQAGDSGRSGVELEAYLKQLFADADTDGSGELSLKEFKELMAMADLGLTAKDVKAILAQADVNSDGTISYAEFVPLAVELVQTLEASDKMRNAQDDAADQAYEFLRNGMTQAELEALIADIFHKADADGSGQLSYAEAEQCLREADLGITTREIKLLLLEVDTDGDNSVSYEEFVPLCFGLLQQIMAEQMLKSGATSDLAVYLKGVLAKADTAKSGRLSQQQLRDALVAADLGLTRIQIAMILGEANEEEEIETFAAKCATMVSAMQSPEAVRVRKEAMSQIELVHGVPQSEISGILLNDLLAYDPKTTGLIGQAQLREAFFNSSLGLSKKEVSALLSASNADNTGLVAYPPLCEYAAQLLAHMASGY